MPDAAAELDLAELVAKIKAESLFSTFVEPEQNGMAKQATMDAAL